MNSASLRRARSAAMFVSVRPAKPWAWPRSGVRLSVPLCAPGRDLEQPPDCLQRDRHHLPLKHYRRNSPKRQRAITLAPNEFIRRFGRRLQVWLLRRAHGTSAFRAQSAPAAGWTDTGKNAGDDCAASERPAAGRLGARREPFRDGPLVTPLFGNDRWAPRRFS